jgi:hypothetical protein
MSADRAVYGIVNAGRNLAYFLLQDFELFYRMNVSS